MKIFQTPTTRCPLCGQMMMLKGRDGMPKFQVHHHETGHCEYDGKDFTGYALEIELTEILHAKKR